MEHDPTCLRFNVLTQTANRTCVICNSDADVHRITLQCRINVFVLRDIFIPEDVGSCQHHLDDQDFFLQTLLPDVEFQSFSPMTKQQFLELFDYCDRVFRDSYRYVSKKDLLMFLPATMPIPHLPNLDNFYRIASAIINRYHPSGANGELAHQLLEKANEINAVQALVEVEHLNTCKAQRWVRDKLQREESEEFQLGMLRDIQIISQPGLIRVRVYSRFSMQRNINYRYRIDRHTIMIWMMVWMFRTYPFKVTIALANWVLELWVHVHTLRVFYGTLDTHDMNNIFGTLHRDSSMLSAMQRIDHHKKILIMHQMLLTFKHEFKCR
ncbi:hypothetical protein ALC57_00308 [Trachymyrmex cornetzi]|uniref:Uncharacterized protein n=1 Tax=Trachymyrmex cornetzi TaxID=471704 RepID=A0A151JSP7_9HYME|nr:hypothetical protein ALC57_00308 [Trachymyrmex cornetzi]